MSENIIKKYKIKAKKTLGQNFLINDNIVTDISNVIKIKGQNIVEVGPGYGALTEKLFNRKPKSLNLIELDIDMISILNDRIKSGEFDLLGVDFYIHNLDVLKYYPKNLFVGQDGYSVIANIPYYITSPIIRHFLYYLNQNPKNMVILMQKDVGDKIIGFPKGKSSVISLMVEKKCYVSEKIFVSKENFMPSPKVESSVLLFKSHSKYLDIPDDKFLNFIKLGFSSARKKLSKNLSGLYDKSKLLKVLEFLGFDNNVRGEDLNIDDWCEFFKKLH